MSSLDTQLSLFYKGPFMSWKCIQDRKELHEFLLQDPAMYLYRLGDLDDFFWPNTQWYGTYTQGTLHEVILLYSSSNIPACITLSRNPHAVKQLISNIQDALPVQFYAHFNLGVHASLHGCWDIQSNGIHHRMALRDPKQLQVKSLAHIQRVHTHDRESVLHFYATSYPNNWFEEHMLQTGQYWGIRQGGQWICIAGVHSYSKRYRVAALGNVATHPEHRGQGWARQVVAHMCRMMLNDVDTIGLNVSQSNTAAIRLYTQLGFAHVTEYEECFVTRTPSRMPSLHN